MTTLERDGTRHLVHVSLEIRGCVKKKPSGLIRFSSQGASMPPLSPMHRCIEGKKKWTRCIETNHLT